MNEMLQEKLDKWFKALVPDSEACETLEGEFVRAINRILYRYYNDGDYWWTGYGCETAGPPVAFLKAYSKPNTDGVLPEEVLDQLVLSDQSLGENYTSHLEEAARLIVIYSENAWEYGLTKNTVDMWDWESEYDDDEEDVDDYY